MKQPKSEIPSQPNNDCSAWWREWFNAVYLDVYAHRDDESAEKEIAAALALLPLQPDQKILDLCCGNGRHCRALRKAGFSAVTGLDYSLPLLEHAMAEDRVKQYTRGDMRLLPFGDGCFDGVLTFFTSFGYFTTNVENLAVLHEIARVLRPGGPFLLDYLNPPHVRRSFVPESVKRQGEFTIRETRSLSSDGERIEKKIVIQNWGEEDHIYHESVRLYEYDQMVDMLQSADLLVSGVSGSFEGHPFQSDSPRMILYGQRSSPKS